MLVLLDQQDQQGLMAQQGLREPLVQPVRLVQLVQQGRPGLLEPEQLARLVQPVPLGRLVQQDLREHLALERPDQRVLREQA